MSEKQLGNRVFVLFFFVTLMILGVLAAGVAVAASGGGKQEAASPPQAFVEEKTVVYLPEREEALTVLLMGAESADAAPGSYLLAGFEPQNGRIPLLALPPDTLVTLGGQTATLAETYRTGGAGAAKAALSETLGVVVERYARVNLPGFVDASTVVGQVEYTLPYGVSFERYGTNLSIPAGLQRMDGRRLGDVLGYRDYPGGELGRMKVLGEVAAAAANQKLELALSPRAETIFRQVVSFLDTDISSRDFAYRLQAARFLARLQVQPAVAIPTLGEALEGEGFALSPQTVALAQKLFHTPEEPGE